jgi:predicted SAM-dependent methyltransferase
VLPRSIRSVTRSGVSGRFVAVRAGVHKRWYAGVIQARSLKRKVSDRRKVKSYFHTYPVRKLQLGTGSNPVAEWLNTDLLPDTYREHRNQIVFLDAAKPFPFDDMTFDYVFSEHQIEHISETDAHTMARECFRVLKPGGRVRVATPDLAVIIGLRHDTRGDLEQHYIEFMMTRFMPDVRSGNPSCHVINHMFRAHGHQFIYDEETLTEMLVHAGFVDVTRYPPGMSGDPALRGLEAHGRTVGDEDVNLLETMVLEASRPSGPIAS